MALVLCSQVVLATASFEVSNFACTPTESSTTGSFSCTATVSNTGDAAGTVGTVTLFPDSDDWLEDSNYPKAVSQSVNAGESVDVTFTGLKGVKSGENSFSRITIDDVSDSSSTITGVEVNIIDVSVSVSNSASSAVMGEEFTSVSEVTAGGSIDVILTFTVNSGGCTIGNQNSQNTMDGMTDGSKQSKTWTVTMGTGGSCKFTVSAAATGSGGVATKTTSVQSTITCPDCPSSSSTTSGGGTAAAGAGGGGENSTELKETTTSILPEKGAFNFLFGGAKHTVKILNLSNTNATISVKSTEKIFTLRVGEQQQVDFDDDGKNEINILLKTISVITNRATLIITPLYTPSSTTASPSSESGNSADEDKTDVARKEREQVPFISNFEDSEWLLGALIILVIVACAVVAILRSRWQNRKVRRSLLRESKG